MLPRVEYSVTVPVPVDTAFQVFLDLDRLLHRGVYEEALWTGRRALASRQPSALRAHSARPRYRLSRRDSVSPPRSVSLLNHGLGITAEQHVTFGPDLHGGTRVRMTMELIGTSTELSESAAREAADFVTRDVLDTIVAALPQLPVIRDGILTREVLRDSCTLAAKFSSSSFC